MGFNATDKDKALGESLRQREQKVVDSLRERGLLAPEPKIITDYVYPPIPIREFDWSATFEGYEPGGVIGWGATEAEAIRDLRKQVDD